MTAGKHPLALSDASSWTYPTQALRTDEFDAIEKPVDANVDISSHYTRRSPLFETDGAPDHERRRFSASHLRHF
jgi:hypothetical protein